MPVQRFYPGNAVAPISPTFSSEWNNTASASRRKLTTATGEYTSSSTIFPNIDSTGVADENVLVGQMVYGPIAAGTSSSYSVKGQILCRERYAGQDCYVQRIVWIAKPDGTERLRLLNPNTITNTAYEFNQSTATRINRYAIGGVYGLADGSWLGGDYLVVEFGFINRGTTVGATVMRGHDTSESPAEDLPEDQTTDDTTARRNWWQFNNEFGVYVPTSPRSFGVVI